MNISDLILAIIVVLLLAGIFYLWWKNKKFEEKNSITIPEPIKKKKKKVKKVDSQPNPPVKSDSMLKLGFTGDLTSFASNSSLVAVASKDRTIRLINSNKKICRCNLEGEFPTAVSLESNFLAAALGDSNSILLCNIEANKAEDVLSCKIQTLVKLDNPSGNLGTIHYLTLGPNFFLTASRDDQTSKLWSNSSGQLLSSYSFNQGSLYSFAAMAEPVGKLIAAGCSLNESKLLTIPSQHESKKALTIAPSSDEETKKKEKPVKAKVPHVSSLASSSTSLVYVTSMCSHRSSVFAVGFSPDGKYCITASTDGTWKIWLSNVDFPREDVRLVNTFPLDKEIYSALKSPDTESENGGKNKNKKKVPEKSPIEVKKKTTSSLLGGPVLLFSAGVSYGTNPFVFFSNGSSLFVYSIGTGKLISIIRLPDLILHSEWAAKGFWENEGTPGNSHLLVITQRNKAVLVFNL